MFRSNCYFALALFTAILIKPEMLQAVNLSDLKLAKITVTEKGDEREITVACLHDRSGVIKNKRFESYATQIANLERQLDAATSDESERKLERRIKRLKARRKAAQKACGDTSDSPIDFSDAVRFVAPVTGSLRSLTSISEPLQDLDAGELAAKVSAISPFAVEDTLQEIYDCATVTGSFPQLTLAFDECTINETTVDGSLTLGISVSGSSIVFTLTFDGFGAGGAVLNGVAILTLTTSSSLGLVLDLEATDSNQQTREVELEGTLSFDSDGGGATIDGSGEYEDQEVSGELEVESLHFSFDDGSCYPDSGTVTLLLGGTEVVIDFSDAVATGEVTVTVGAFPPITEPLPECPE